MSKTKAKGLKLNNNGSTLVMAILAIAFVSLLASVLMAASVSNMIMKRIDDKSKSTFYTAESVLDEIKVGVGTDSMTSMAEAYEIVLSNLIITDDAYEIDYMMDNDTANAMLQNLFMDNMVSLVTNSTVSFTDVTDKKVETSSVTLENAKNYLSKYISKTELRYATIKSIESVTIIKDYNGIKNKMTLNNVVLNYKTQSGTDTYFADVTVDIDVAYPNMTVDFTASNRLTEFKEFALIADNEVRVNATTDNITATVNAGIYAGTNINVESSTSAIAHLAVGANTLSGMSSNIVARKDIIITGSQRSVDTPGNVAKFDVNKSDLWCDNLTFGYVPGGDAFNDIVSAGVEVTINSDSNTYIRDDMNVNGENSIVTVGGNYYGYSYQGVSTDHSKSSAIIVDGAGSRLNLGTDAIPLSKFILGGHSYIVYGSGSGVADYMTGESLSFTGNQELYLVPSEYVGVGYKKDVANPMPEDTWAELQTAAASDATIKVVDMSGFFAKDEGLLDDASDTSCYEVKIVNDLVYLYLKFDSNDSKAQYISDVIAGVKAPELTSKLKKYTSQLLNSNVDVSGSVNIKEGGQIYTAGVLMETSGSDVDKQVGTSYEGNLGADVLGVTSIDLTNRFTIMTQLLTPIPFEVNGSKYIVNSTTDTLEDLLMYYVTGNELDPATAATENIVDWDMVVSDGYNDDTAIYSLQGAASALKLTKIAKDGDVVIPTDIKGGIVVATGDVTVQSDFTGLIIAKGNISIKGNATITTDENLVEQLLTFEFQFNEGANEEEVPYRNYFYAYKSTSDGSEEIKIESLGYDDLVGLNNWRKYDDSAAE